MKRILNASGLLALSLSAMAETTLKIGDPAPPIKSGEWIQGEPVTSFSKDNVYVVEFWATWCGPCVATIPHLDELHEELKNTNVVFIGQNCWEKDLTKVKPFVAKMGEKMSYRVATDDTSSDKTGYMAVKWMQAAGQTGIPAAFVVGKDGKIAWIGHPRELKVDMLKQVAAGSFDPSKVVNKQEPDSALKAQVKNEMDKLHATMRTGDWDAVNALLDEMEKSKSTMQPFIPQIRLQGAIKKGDQAALVKLVEKMMADPATNFPKALNALAREVSTGVKDPSAELLAAIRKAAEKSLAQDNSNRALETLARIQFMQGQKDEAISTQEKAMAAAPDGQKDKLRETLDSYKKGILPAAN